MEKPPASRDEELARLRERLKELKSTLPEHCSDTQGYIDAHHASTEHWQKIEETEDRIKELEARPGA